MTELEARTDALHAQVLGMIPPGLFDLGDLAAGVARIEQMLGAVPQVIPDGVAVQDHTVESIDGHPLTVRVYRPAALTAPVPALYWMHGGGMVLGDVSIDAGQCAARALELGIVVASVDYRRAPSVTYPTPLDDCDAGYEWLVAHAADLGVDPARIAVGGPSAGGGLAAALTLRRRDRRQSLPCFQFLRYPMLDDRHATESSRQITDTRVWNRDANLAAWGAYLGRPPGSPDVPAHAAPARAADLSGLPPALVTVGGLDLFLDEDIAYAQALLHAGVPAELHVYPPAFHGSDEMVPHSPVSERWRRDEHVALRAALGLA